MAQSKQNENGTFTMTGTGSLTTDQWVAVVVVGALGVLILLRNGFRGVNVMGANVSL